MSAAAVRARLRLVGPAEPPRAGLDELQDRVDELAALISRLSATAEISPGAAPVQHLVERVAARWLVGTSAILERRRDPRVAAARSIVAWLAHHPAVGDLSYAEIGRALDRDHTSIMAACRRVQAQARLLASAKAIALELGIVIR